MYLRSPFTLAFSAIADQMSHKQSFESVALQRFQNFAWFGVEHKALYVKILAG
jgi:hypothetical protein